MKIIGHRGARGLATENTLSGLKAGMESGADAIEFDLRKTKDNVLVLHHDPTLKRIYGVNAEIAASNYKDLHKYTLNFDDQIIRFEEALSFVQDFPINIEVKAEGSSKLMIDILNQYPMAKPVAITSFKSKALIEYQNIDGKLPTFLAPGKYNWLYIIAIAKKNNFAGITPHTGSLVVFPFLIMAKLLKLKIIAYPVNNRLIARMFLFLNSDTFLCSDYPDRLQKLRN